MEECIRAYVHVHVACKHVCMCVCACVRVCVCFSKCKPVHQCWCLSIDTNIDEMHSFSSSLYYDRR